MVLTALRTEGLRDGGRLVELDRAVSLPVGRAGAALADGLELLAASLVPDRLPAVLVGLGLADRSADVELEVEAGLPVGVSWTRPAEADALLVSGERRLAVEAMFELDPPFFGRLREHAARDPRLVAALGEAPRLTVKVGFMFHPRSSGAHVGLLGLVVGDTAFPVSGSERPSWAGAVLGDVGRRVQRVRHGASASAVAGALAAAAHGPDPEVRRRARAAFVAVCRSPFGFEAVDVVRDADHVVATTGPDLFRLDRLGVGAAHALALARAVHVEQPDILVVDAPGAGFGRPARVARWLAGRTRGRDATLEQVLFVEGPR
jgi:hypothetical protein